MEELVRISIGRGEKVYTGKMKLEEALEIPGIRAVWVSTSTLLSDEAVLRSLLQIRRAISQRRALRLHRLQH